GSRLIAVDERFYGSDRDAGAITMSKNNAQRAGIDPYTVFKKHAVSDLRPPSERPGLVITNPPYGARIGERSDLRNLYATLGRVLKERFQGWRVGLITSERSLAHATGLPFKKPSPPVPHGGLRVQLYQTRPLPPAKR
ncbi:MAG: class I SAM-dependent RNA methyltransferase, partial [Myxococcota bacterium]